MKRDFTSHEEAFLAGLASVPFVYPTQEDIDKAQQENEEFTDPNGRPLNQNSDGKRVYSWGVTN